MKTALMKSLFYADEAIITTGPRVSVRHDLEKEDRWGKDSGPMYERIREFAEQAVTQNDIVFLPESLIRIQYGHDPNGSYDEAPCLWATDLRFL